MEYKIHQDVLIGFFIMIFCVIVFLIARCYPLGVKMLPNICVIIIFLLSCSISYSGILKTYESKKQQEPIINSLAYRNIVVPSMAYIYIVGYYILFKLAGFFIATPIFMIAILRHLSVKSWKQNIQTVLFFILFLYLLFVKQFNVSVLNLGKFGTYFGIY